MSGFEGVLTRGRCHFGDIAARFLIGGNNPGQGKDIDAPGTILAQGAGAAGNGGAGRNDVVDEKDAPAGDKVMAARVEGKGTRHIALPGQATEAALLRGRAAPDEKVRDDLLAT